jgi:hypothetical protein
MQRGATRTAMSNGDDPSVGTAARDSRRWLVGIIISLVFGLFSAAMALLSYSSRPMPAAPPGVTPATKTPSTESRRRGNTRRDRRAPGDTPGGVGARP